jgi:4-amino-4-deoxy-L-arabinose transferase-like glycosyltransferase
MRPVLTHETLLDRPRLWRVLVAAVLGLALLATARGVAQAPLDVHEIYVLETAQQMLERGDWVVPFFNDRPRLNKPPLNYWLTATLGRLAGNGRVQPWHGRLPSALSGAGLVLLTLLLGARLFGRECGLLAGLMLATTNGYFSYASDARPEMLYAFLCALGLAAFIAALRAPDRSARQAWAALGMWLAYALATLAKGPQVPAMFLLAGIVYCALQQVGVARTLRSFRPVSGLMLWVLIAVPWWLVLSQRLPAGALENSQLGGTLVSERWARSVQLYYLYHPTFKLFMPWTLLLPALIGLRWLAQEARSQALLLGIVYLAMVVLFSFNNHYRSHYLLPGLMPGCLLLAAGTLTALQQLQPGQALLAARGLLTLAGAGAIAGLAWGLYTGGAAGTARFQATVGLALTLGLLLAAGHASRSRKLAVSLHVPAAALMLALMAAGLGGVLTHRQHARDTSIEIAAAVARAAGPDTPVVTWGCNPDAFVYYLGRSVAPMTSLDEVTAALARSPGGRIVLIVPRTRLTRLPANLRVTPLAADELGGERAAVLLQPARGQAHDISLTNP